jgi:hypothetical protein
MVKQWKNCQIMAGIIVGAVTINVKLVQAQQPALVAQQSISVGVPDSSFDKHRGKAYEVPIDMPVEKVFTIPEILVGVPVGTVDEVQIYFKKRWKRDPNFKGYLQYHLTLQADGRVKSIVGIGDNSQIYLAHTNFVRPGEKLVTASDREHVVQLFLNGNGAVGVYPLKMPPS